MVPNVTRDYKALGTIALSIIIQYINTCLIKVAYYSSTPVSRLRISSQIWFPDIQNPDIKCPDFKAGNVHIFMLQYPDCYAFLSRFLVRILAHPDIELSR